MTITAHHPDRSALDPALDERQTDSLNARHPFVVDSYSMLDHRTRERTIPRADAPPGRYLAVECGNGGERLIALERPITHIGRGLIADVRLEDPHVSRRHAILALRGNGARVLDDRSSNGTFVNGRRVTVSPLADGDVVRFGSAVFRYIEATHPGKAEPVLRLPMSRRDRRRQPAVSAA